MIKGWALVVLGVLILGSMLPAVSGQTPQHASLPLGVTLYVGGSGLGNYTSIQDAVDAAAPGDTVFVYDESAPYVESVIINKSISLIGERESTTVLYGMHNYTVLTLTADGVVVRNFTLRDAESVGVSVRSNGDVLSHLTIVHCWRKGIDVSPIPTRFSSTSISDCTISYSQDGIYLKGANDTVVERNTVVSSEYGLAVVQSTRSTVIANVFRSNVCGIGCSLSWNNSFARNYIWNNTEGVYLLNAVKERFVQNTFQGNFRDAWFLRIPFIAFVVKVQAAHDGDHYFARSFPVVGTSTWSRNYWEKPRLLPYPIFGVRGILSSMLVAQYGLYYGNSVMVDWLPAQTPYDLT